MISAPNNESAFSWLWLFFYAHQNDFCSLGNSVLKQNYNLALLCHSLEVTLTNQQIQFLGEEMLKTNLTGKDRHFVLPGALLFRLQVPTVYTVFENEWAEDITEIY